MSTHFNYHKKTQRWELFESDLAEFFANKKKYSGIFQRPETYSFGYRANGKQLKTCQRLADIYEFKLQWESQNES